SGTPFILKIGPAGCGASLPLGSPVSEELYEVVELGGKAFTMLARLVATTCAILCTWSADGSLTPRDCRMLLTCGDTALMAAAAFCAPVPLCEEAAAATVSADTTCLSALFTSPSIPFRIAPAAGLIDPTTAVAAPSTVAMVDCPLADPSQPNTALKSFPTSDKKDLKLILFPPYCFA